MITPELDNYITSAREFGLSDAEIIVELTNAGWETDDIQLAIGGDLTSTVNFSDKSKHTAGYKVQKNTVNDTVPRKIHKAPVVSMAPLAFVSVISVFIIIGAMYASKLFSLEIDRVSSITADTTNIYNDLIIQKKEAIARENDGYMLFVGDIMLSDDRGTGAKIKENGDYKYPFLRIAHILRDADISFGNLEGPISSQGKDSGGKYSFRADPRVISGLKYAGFDLLSIANNHIFDWGKEAFLDTLSLLRSSGIDTVGGGINANEANRPVIKTINGTDVAFFAFSAVDYDAGVFEADAYNAGKSSYSIDSIVKNIKKVKDSTGVDIVVVSFHWGNEYQTRSSSWQQETARIIIDAGADIIVGHHPHVVQEIERYKNGWIAYSLGNFVFDQTFSEETMEGLMLKVEIKSGKISNIDPIEIKISDTFQPYIKSI